MATQGVHKKRKKTKRHMKGESIKFRRGWEVHKNLSTVPGDQQWQEHDYRESDGLVGRQKLPRPKHEGNTRKKKGRPVFGWPCESARLPGPYLAKCGEIRSSLDLRGAVRASSLDLGGAVRANGRRRPSGYKMKVKRLGVKSPSIGGGIVKNKHK